MTRTEKSFCTGLVHGLCLLVFIAISSAKECDRHRSIVARAISHQVLFPHVEWSKTRIPAECPLHPDRDVYAALENTKLKKDAAHWECDSCGKLESSHDLIDGHVHEEHPELKHEGGDVCLADFCDILHCDYLATKMDLDGTHEHRSYDETAPCDPEKNVKLRIQCVELANECFTPWSGPNAHLMSDFMRNDFCAAHVCDMEERHQLLTSIVERHHWARWRYYVIAIVIFAIGVVLFISLYIKERLSGFTLSKQEYQDWAALQRFTQFQKMNNPKQL